MKQVIALAIFFFKSFVKLKSTYILVFVALFSLILSFFLSDIDIGKQYKLFEDFFLTTQMFILHVAAFFYGYEYIQKERISGVFILPLATGLSRRSYLLSVILGQLFVLGSIFSALILIDSVALILLEGSVTFSLLWQLTLYFLSSLIIIMLIILFSQFVSSMNSMIYALIFFVVGNSLDELYVYAYYVSKNSVLQLVSDISVYIIPNFSIFDKQGIVVNRSDVDSFYLYGEPLIYLVLAVSILFFITNLKLSNRVLKVGE